MIFNGHLFDLREDALFHCVEHAMIGKKGTYGYIRKRRKLLAFLSVVLLAAVLGMYFGAQWYFKTNKNIFTIIAALRCIGVGKCVDVDFLVVRLGMIHLLELQRRQEAGLVIVYGVVRAAHVELDRAVGERRD